jgi:small subunit ribosomal protein S6
LPSPRFSAIGTGDRVVGLRLPPALFWTTAGGATDGPSSAIGMKGQRDMALYEHVFLARQDLAQAQVDALAEAAAKIITDGQGQVVKTENWGLRSIAYRIKKNRKAHYVMLELEAPAGVVAELERQTSINEDVIRYMTVRVDAHEQGPSAMMRRSERGERRGGRDGERGDRGDRGDRGGRDRDRGPRDRDDMM